ncbi:hypothetical protein Tco_1181520 [Tanacetum coccineum]
MSLEHEIREAKAAEAIHLRSQVFVVKAVEAARHSLKKLLEGQVVALESIALSCDELSVKASSLEFEKDKLVDQVLTPVPYIFNLCPIFELWNNHFNFAVQDVQSRCGPIIDHGKVGRVLAEVTAYNPVVEAYYVAAVNALRVVDFPFLA